MEKAAGQMLSTHAECFEGRFFGGVNDAPVRSCSFAGCRSPELDRVGCRANLRGWVPVSWFVDQRFIAHQPTSNRARSQTEAEDLETAALADRSGVTTTYSTLTWRGVHSGGATRPPEEQR